MIGRVRHASTATSTSSKTKPTELGGATADTRTVSRRGSRRRHGDKVQRRTNLDAGNMDGAECHKNVNIFKIEFQNVKIFKIENLNKIMTFWKQNLCKIVTLFVHSGAPFSDRLLLEMWTLFSHSAPSMFAASRFVRSLEVESSMGMSTA